LREAEFIRSLADIGKLKKGVIGIGDDAALFGGYLVSKDIMAEGVHFLIKEGEEQIARRLVVSNISDICAMGGRSRGYCALLGAGISPKIDSAAFAAAFRKECEKYNITLLGGDTISSPSAFFSMTIIGRSNRFVLTRTGAKAGDILYLSRPIGKAKVLLEKKLAGNFGEFEYFPPKTRLGELLGGTQGVGSCIDISDGLGIDLARTADASRVDFYLSSKDIPLGAEGINPMYAAGSGEEYALAFSVRQDRCKYLEEMMNIKLDRSIYRIGYVAPIAGDRAAVYMDGQDISELGYEHTV
jgi:thiamine-monophosphate kinase